MQAVWQILSGRVKPGQFDLSTRRLFDLSGPPLRSRVACLNDAARRLMLIPNFLASVRIGATWKRSWTAPDHHDHADMQAAALFLRAGGGLASSTTAMTRLPSAGISETGPQRAPMNAPTLSVRAITPRGAGSRWRIAASSSATASGLATRQHHPDRLIVATATWRDSAALSARVFCEREPHAALHLDEIGCRDFVAPSSAPDSCSRSSLRQDRAEGGRQRVRHLRAGPAAPDRRARG